MVPGKGREGLESGLAGLCWGLEWRVGRFLDVYVLDKGKPLLRGLLVLLLPSVMESNEAI